MAAGFDVIDLTWIPRGLLKVQMKLIICTKFYVNWMNFVASRRGPIDNLPKVFVYFFSFKASSVKATRQCHGSLTTRADL